jgi:hypothetical protein
MFRATFLVFLLSMVITAKDCDINLGNLDEFVVNYQVTVINSSAEPAAVWIAGNGVKRFGTLKQGGEMGVTAFQPGSVLVSVSPATDYLADLKLRREAVTARLNKKPFLMGDALAIYEELQIVNSQIQSYEASSHGSLCVHEFKEQKSEKVAFTITLDGDKLACAEG